jgi:hypothetical protein
MRAGCLREVAAAITVTQVKVAAAVAASPISFLLWAERARVPEAVEAEAEQGAVAAEQACHSHVLRVQFLSMGAR